jgi:flagellar hook-associated protein 1 FlgK
MLMLGLYGSFNLGARSPQVQQTGVAAAGQNSGSIDKPADARQPARIQNRVAVPAPVRPRDTGAHDIDIQQIRDSLLRGLIRGEASVGGYWNAQQSVLLNAQTLLGAGFNPSASGAAIAQGFSARFSALFSGFQAVATDPGSLPERQALVKQAQALAGDFHETARRLASVHERLDNSLRNDLASANRLLSDIASLNGQIAGSQGSTRSAAHDLCDRCEQRLQSLANLMNFDASAAVDGPVDIGIGSTLLVSGQQVFDSLQAYDAGGGRLLVQAATAGTPLALTGGSIQGIIAARDGALKTLRDNFDTLAATLISEVNTPYRTGFDQYGNTGARFFTGTTAATIGVNPALSDDPLAVQAAGTADSPGDNRVAVALAQLAAQPVAALGNQTFHEACHSGITALGDSLTDARDQLANHATLNTLLASQRDSLGGVSLEEEMTGLITFQKAFQASAGIIGTVDQWST